MDKIYERSENLVFLFLCDLILSLRDMNINARSYNVTREPDLAKKFIELLDVDSLFEFIDKHDFENKHIVQSYYLAYLMNENFEEEKYFYRLNNYRGYIVGNKFVSDTNRNSALQFIEDYNLLLKLKLDPEDFDLIHSFKKKLDESKNYPGKS